VMRVASGVVVDIGTSWYVILCAHIPARKPLHVSRARTNV